MDAGHFQVELTLISFTSDRDSSGGLTRRTDAWAIAPTNLRIGLLNRLEAQLVLEAYNGVYEREATNRVTRRGYGDTGIWKWLEV